MKHIQTHQILALLAAGFGLTQTASAQFVTGFETAQGYTLDATLTGVDDPVLTGTDSWYVTPSLSGGGSIRTHGGSNALRLSDTNSSGWSVGLNVASAIDFTRAFNLSFDLAVASFTIGTATGTTPVMSVRLGADTNSNSNKTWARISFNADGSLSVWENNGGTTTKQTHIGYLNDFVTAGTYLNVSITVDPVSHTYTALTLSGDKLTESITIAGTVLPWIPNNAGEPPAILWAHTTGSPTSTSYIDNVSLTNIPEPSTYAALLGLGGLFAAVCRRGRRA